MATWMIHFRVAEEMLRHMGEEITDLPAFVLGNVAPDSGIPDADGMNYTPPRAISHFGKSGQRDYDRFLHEYYHTAKKDTVRSFLLGYYLHLLTDDAWVEQILKPTYDRLGADFADYRSFTEKMREEWAELDRRYLAEQKDISAYRTFCAIQAFDHPIFPFFPDNAFTLQLKRIQEFYAVPPTGQEIRFADGEMLDKFVYDASSVMENKLKSLWGKGELLCI